MMRRMFYNWSEWEESQWKYHKMVNPSSKQSEQQGCSRYEGFDSFAMDQFHWLYADEHRMADEATSGLVETDCVFEKMNNLRNEIPELEDLREDCRGDDDASGIACAAVLDDLMTLIDATDEQPVKSSSEDHKTIESLKQLMKQMSGMLDESGAPVEIAGMEEAIKEVQATIEAKEEHARNVAQMMDDTDIRNSLRQSAQKAKEAIQDHRSMMSGWMAGADLHSGTLANRAQANAMRDKLRDSERLQRIGRIAGRLKRHALEKQREKAKFGIDEVVDVELGNDMSRMLPSEMVWMDDDMDHVFVEKLDNHTLAQKRMRGKEKETRGPIVAIVDSSGSMTADDCDIWAAGYCLALLEIAVLQNRDFAILHFGDRVLRQDIFEKDQIPDVAKRMDAISFFASCGGTNFMVPLKEGTEMIEKQGAFKKADLVLITDGCAPVTKQFQDEFNAKREELGFSLYSVLVDNRYSDQELATRELGPMSAEVINMRSMEDDDDATDVFGSI